MITLEQVQTLDAKIKQAVGLISTLREENAQLRSALSGYETKVSDLEKIVFSLEDGQTKIEMGLIDAISKLDDLVIVDKIEKEETSEELSPSEETGIVEEEQFDENDHSEQAENTTEDSLSIDSKNDFEPIATIEIETEEVAAIEVETEEVAAIEVETEEVAAIEVETEEVVIEEKSEKKNKSNDYSIPMLEIF